MGTCTIIWYPVDPHQRLRHPGARFDLFRGLQHVCVAGFRHFHVPRLGTLPEDFRKEPGWAKRTTRHGFYLRVHLWFDVKRNGMALSLEGFSALILLCSDGGGASPNPTREAHAKISNIIRACLNIHSGPFLPSRRTLFLQCLEFFCSLQSKLLRPWPLRNTNQAHRSKAFVCSIQSKLLRPWPLRNTNQAHRSKAHGAKRTVRTLDLLLLWNVIDLRPSTFKALLRNQKEVDTMVLEDCTLPRNLWDFFCP